MNHALLKQLARKHGCLERIHIDASSSEGVPQKLQQTFDYVVVIDFESTCWNNEDKFKFQPEVIEFPAVLLNIRTGAVEDEFQQYVMPTENPRLSHFCKTFTGIKQEEVDNGVPLATCLLLFSRWIKKIAEEKSLLFHKKDSTHKSCTFVTWSDWDLSTCLDNECKRKNLLKPEVLNQWIDLRATYKMFYKRQPKGLNGALSEVGLKFEGRQHSGISDARNTAALVHHLVKDGAVLSITKVLQAPSLTKNMKYSTENYTQTKHILHNSATRYRKISLNSQDTPVSSRHGYQRIKIYQESMEKFVKSSLCKRTSLRKDNKDVGKGQDRKASITPRDRTPLQPIKCLPYESTTSIKQNPGGNCRITPPFCNCGRRSLRKIVSMLGPNQGRTFYVCSHNKALGTVRKSGCGFFKWEP